MVPTDPTVVRAEWMGCIAGGPHVRDLWCALLHSLIYLVLWRWFAVLFRGIQQGLLSLILVSPSDHGCKSRGGPSRARGGVFQFWILFVLCQSVIRIGEARNPGPEAGSSSWTVGTFNPTGLTSKSDIVSALDGDFWGVTETHLSQVGVRQLKAALHCQKSKHRYFVPGAPCNLRSNSEHVGNFSGVAALSQWPTRALPHDLDSVWYNSSRVQIVGTCIASLWIQVAVVYGFPYSTTHRFPKYQTDQLLEGIVDRLCLQASGPRIIMGDFNWPSSELDQVRRLEHFGFRELQQIAKDWWDRDILPTGHSRQIDFVYISPELLPYLQDVIVDSTQWSDHASVQGVFAGPRANLDQFRWRMPQPVDWPSGGEPIDMPVISDPTVSYAQLWHTAEQAASAKLQSEGRPGLSSVQCGRAQTFDTERHVPFLCPLRKSRSHEVQPVFMGVSCRYAQQFKQLRRIQSLVKALRKNPYNPAINPLWTSIRRSTGFPGGFCHWWTTVGFPLYGGLELLPLVVPSLAGCEVLFQGLQKWVTSFGNELKLSRLRIAKRRRQSDLHHVFKDCARDPPKQVDLLVHTVQAEVVACDFDACTLELDRPSPFRTDVPLLGGGHAMAITDQFESQIAVEGMAPIDSGDKVRQTQVVTEVSAVLEAFRAEWEPRWSRLDHLHDSQWTQIIEFAQHSLSPITWNFPPITPMQFTRAISTKKKTAAVGPDGISRKDLLSLSPMIAPASVALCHHAESTGRWPRQLTLGVVSLLEKCRDALEVRHYRPVVVYPLTYRAWSSIRGRQMLRALGSTRPWGMRGGMPPGAPICLI